MNSTLTARVAAAVLLALLTPQCLTPAAERAERDSTIGIAEADTYSVRVTDGLAAVRTADENHLELWLSAPAITVDLSFSTTVPITLDIANLMPTTVVRLIRGAAEIEVLSTERKAQRLRLTPNDIHGVRLAIGPADTSTRAFRFGLMSDVQEAIDRVSDVYARVNAQPDIEFLLGAGDLTQRGHLDQLRHFERELEHLDVPYYTTLGNHELGVEPPPYQDLFGRGSFSFEFRGVRFTMLDSASATLDPKVYEWLDGWLAQGRQQFHVIAMHVPPVDPVGVRNGSFASRTEANKLFSRLTRGKVDLTLYGHVHSFYDFENANIPAMISGGGGAIPERFDGLGRHFVMIDVDPESQTFTHEIVRVD